MATFRKRGSKQWQAIIRIKGYPTRIKSGFATKTQARRWAECEEAAMRTGEWVDRRRAEQITLGELFVKYGTEISSRKRSAKNEQLRLRILGQHPLADRIVATIRPEDINAYISERLAAGLMGSTVNRDINLLHHLFVIARIGSLAFPAAVGIHQAQAFSCDLGRA